MSVDVGVIKRLDNDDLRYNFFGAVNYVINHPDSKDILPNEFSLIRLEMEERKLVTFH